MNKGGDSMYVVYAHVFPNGKRYIGITCQDTERRWRKGKGYSYNKILTNAFKKYGWENIEHLILFDNLTREEAEEKEIELILKYDLTNGINGYNYSLGGGAGNHTEETKKILSEKCSGFKHSKEAIEKIRISSAGRKHTEESKSKISESHKGKIFSAESRARMSESKKGKPPHNKGVKASAETKGKLSKARMKKVLMLDVNTCEVLGEFDCSLIAQKITGVINTSITKVCRGVQVTAGGYKWAYSNE